MRLCNTALALLALGACAVGAGADDAKGADEANARDDTERKATNSANDPTEPRLTAQYWNWYAPSPQAAGTFECWEIGALWATRGFLIGHAPSSEGLLSAARGIPLSGVPTSPMCPCPIGWCARRRRWSPSTSMSTWRRSQNSPTTNRKSCAGNRDSGATCSRRSDDLRRLAQALSTAFAKEQGNHKDHNPGQGEQTMFAHVASNDATTPT